MRTKNVLRNSTYSIASFLLIFSLGVIERKLFLKYLNIEFLGYEGLFSNIFALLSLAELGIGTVITYSLYKEIASKNEEEISKLMMMYKYMYRIIGVIVTIIGLILLPLLKYIITDNMINFNYIRIIFILQLIATICTYFLSYKRVLYLVDQKQFICVQVDTTISIVAQVTRIFILIMFKDYISYLIIAIAKNILSNIIISHKSKKDYPYVKKVRIRREDFLERNFFKDIKNFMIHKISYIVYGGIDNIIVSIFLGVTWVGMVSNYMLIKAQVSNLLSKIIAPMQASIGNLVYSEEKEKGKQIFFAFNMIGFCLGTFTSISHIVLFQAVIELWLGKEYLLPEVFVLLLSINFYISWTHIITSTYREVFGKYEQDRKYMILSAITNIILSIIFVNIWGVSGVMGGTVIGNILIIYGRIQFVFKVYLKTSHKIYIIKHMVLSLVALAEGTITYFFASFIPTTTLGVLGKLLLCLIIPNIINLIIFYKTKEFKVFKIYLNQICKIIIEKFKKLGI